MRDTRTIRSESPWDVYHRLLAAAEITDPAEPDLAPYAANARLRHRVPLPVAVLVVIAVLMAAVKLPAVIYLLGGSRAGTDSRDAQRRRRTPRHGDTAGAGDSSACGGAATSLA